MNWLGTVFYLVGMVLTAANVYPLNLLFGALGGFIWMLVGIARKDMALIVVELAAAGIYLAGLFHWLLSLPALGVFNLE